jgi:dienelactone hydrolase
MSGGAMKLIELYRPALNDKEGVERALMPVEKVNGPVLLVSGRDDALWPSTQMADEVIQRLKKFHHPHRSEHLAYDGDGHGIRKAYLPAAGTVSNRVLVLDGSEEANAKAQADSWPKVLDFLRKSLQTK